MKKSTEHKAIEEKYQSYTFIDDNHDKVTHGKLIEINKNTNCLYIFCRFERGNEIVTTTSFEKTVKKYIESKIKPTK